MLIESHIIAHLAAKMTGCLICAEVPEDYPADGALVVVSRLGGGNTNHLRTARIAIQTYGASLLDAATRCETALGYMLELPADDPCVTAVHIDTSYNWTDETTKRYRYQSVMYVTYYDWED